jgi:hypothetical protein
MDGNGTGKVQGKIFCEALVQTIGHKSILTFVVVKYVY